MARAQIVYEAVCDEDGSWSVVERCTGLALLVRGIPMVMLTEGTARSLVKMLNTNNIISYELH